LAARERARPPGEAAKKRVAELHWHLSGDGEELAPRLVATLGTDRERFRPRLDRIELAVVGREPAGLHRLQRSRCRPPRRSLDSGSVPAHHSLDVRAKSISELRGMNIDHAALYLNMTLAACRAAGARGGRRSARSRRLRKATAMPVSRITEPEPETAAEAIARIDALCPWLRGVERRTVRRLSA